MGTLSKAKIVTDIEISGLAPPQAHHWMLSQCTAFRYKQAFVWVFRRPAQKQTVFFFYSFWFCFC